MKYNKYLKRLSLAMTLTLGLGAATGVTFDHLFASKDGGYQEIKQANAEDDVLYIAGSANNLITGSAPSGVTLTKTSTLYTLTLANYSYTGAGLIISGNYFGLYYKGDKDLNIVLSGTNLININTSATGMGSYSHGISLERISNKRKVVVKGDGELTVRAYSMPIDTTASYGMYVKHDFYLEESNGTTNPKLYLYAGNGGTGNVSCFSYGFLNYNNVTINRGTIEAYGGSSGQDSIGFECSSFTMNGGSAKFVAGTATGVEADTYGFSGDSPVINGGTLVCQGGTKGSGNTNGKSYGIRGFDEYGRKLTINSGVTSVTATGNDCAIKADYKVANKVKGKGWTNTAGTGTGTLIEVSTSGTALGNTYKKVKFGGIIEATATGWNGEYDGNPHSINVNVTKPSSGYSIQYRDGTSGSWSATLPTYTNVGSYTTYYKINATNYDEASGSQTVVISKGTPTYTAPTVKTDLKYTGSSQDLINAGTTEDGTLYYKLDSGAYDTAIPSATNPGTYSVKYKLTGDSNHTNIDETALADIVIGNADLADVDVSVVGNYVYTGSAQSPTVTKTATTVDSSEVTFTFSSSESGSYGEDLPTFVETGTHVIYYKANATYHNEASGNFNFVIGKMPPASLSDDQKPTAKINLVYTGEEQALLNLPINPVLPVGYTNILYSLYAGSSWGSWSESIPTVINAGTYRVRYQVLGDANHADIAPVEINGIVVAKIDPTYTAEPTAVADLVYTGKAHNLVNAGATQEGTLKYSLFEDRNYEETIPSATNVDTYKVFYKIFGDINHNDSEVKVLQVVISQNDKSALVSAINEAGALYNEITSGYPTVAATLKEAIDAAKAVNDNPNVTVKQISDAVEAIKAAIAKAKDDSRNIIIDDKDGVTIETSDGTGIPTSIDLRVEVRTDVKAEEGSVAREKIEAMLEGRDKISNVYDVKLIQTIDGVEKEIQPSDIKKDMKIIVHIAIPEDINVDTLKILHIHSENDMEYLENFKVEGEELVFEVDRFSEFAFVTPGTGFPAWAIVLIVLGSLFLLLALFLLVLFIFFPRYIIDYSKKKVIRTIYLKNEDGLILLLDTSLRKVRRSEVDVYRSKEEAEKAL